MSRSLKRLEAKLVKDKTLAKVSKLLKERQEQNQTASQNIPADILEFIPFMTKGMKSPTWLSPLTAKLNDILELKPTQYLFSVPPRHYKTYTLLYFIALYLALHPNHDVLYITNNATLANKHSRIIRRLCEQLGMQFQSDSNRQDEWELVGGGSLVARGVDSAVTGRGADLIIVDDPIASRFEAESGKARDNLYESIKDDIFTRLTPNGSIVVLHTRWHVDDLIGRLSKDGLQYDNLPALTVVKDQDGCETYLPLSDIEGRGVEFLLSEKKRLGAYSFASLFQGEPVPRAGQLFTEPHYYYPDQLFTSDFQIANGTDLAYSAFTKGDYCVILELRKRGEKYQVVNLVRRQQINSATFADVMKEFCKNNKAKVYWYGSATERGTADLMVKEGVPLTFWVTVKDKFQRAQACSNAYNAGNILLPYVGEGGFNAIRYAWVEELISELASFTGKNDTHDDQVDALVAAFDALNKPLISFAPDFSKYREQMPQRRM